jgi:polysaccharide deacetylase family protein (PEP-CTERM system associated)
MSAAEGIMTQRIAGDAPPSPLDGVSVDVEDYFQVEAFADRISPATWPNFPSRVVDNTRRVLELFAELGLRATFFILGYVAERYPVIVREITGAGHEVGCHSFFHQHITRLTPEEFRADTRRAVSAIEDACGKKVLGYRAPTFSILSGTLWALTILAEEGFIYDSSVFPVRHDLYGMPGMPRFLYQWNLHAGMKLYEIPPTTVRIIGQNLPACGGGYLRLLPMRYTRWAFNRVRDHDSASAFIYFHPWEIDPKQPRLKGTWKSRLRHYYNLHKMEPRLRELLRRGRFAPLHDVLEAQVARTPLPVRALSMHAGVA